MTDFFKPTEDVKRDRWGRPLILDVNGDKEIAYQRVTTFAGLPEDEKFLTDWKIRNALVGMAYRPELALAILAARDDKRALNKLAQEALAAAQTDKAAKIGTAMHALTERIDRGEELGPVPAEFADDLLAYVVATDELEVTAIEQFVVVDQLMVGGTLDRIYEYNGKLYIGDIKTSATLDFGVGKFAIQLGSYAHGKLYNFATQERSPMPNVDQNRGILVHMPAGQKRVDVYWLDIATGWEIGAKVAKDVRDWRKVKSSSLLEAW